MTCIRKAATADLDAIERIYNELHQAEEDGLITTGWARGIYPTRKTAEEALERDDLFVLVKDGNVLGSGIINQIQVDVYAFAPWKYAAPDKQVCVLHTLVISPKAGRKGLGKTFVQFYEEYAAEHHCPELRIDTNERNQAARAMYKKLGYREVATVPTVFNNIPDVNLVLLEKHMELWDLYDSSGQPTGEIWIRGNKRQIPEGRYHIVCDVLIRNTDGEYLLTLRDPHKDVHPGEWEASAGGSALSGENPLQAAEREMMEETGLTADGMKLIGQSMRGNCIFYSYLAETRCERDSVRLQEGETVDFRWVNKAGLVAFSHSDIGLKSHNERYRSFFDQLEKETDT